MGIAEEYVKRVKTPIIKVTATKFSSDDTPGVENEGTDYFPEVVSCDITYGFDQASTTCTLELSTPLDVNGDYVRFTPMDRVKVEQGWNKPSTYRVTFFGFIDKVEYDNPPKTAPTVAPAVNPIKVPTTVSIIKGRTSPLVKSAVDFPKPNNPPYTAPNCPACFIL